MNSLVKSLGNFPLGLPSVFPKHKSSNFSLIHSTTVIRSAHTKIK